MCGIYGFTGHPTKQTGGIIKKLGELNESRGRDSTGLALIGMDKTILYKNTVEAEKFFKDQKTIEYLCAYRKKEYITILGHTRLATRGAITSENAHPFKEGSIFFTHNGVINNFDELLTQYNIKRDVDSQIIGWLLANKPSFKEAFAELQGYFTTPYVDIHEPDNLKVAVYSNVFAFATREKQLYYSSEMDHLKKALGEDRGFNFCEGGKSVQYSFYPVGNSIAISKEAITAKPYSSSYSYTYDDDDYGYMSQSAKDRYEETYTRWEKHFTKKKKKELRKKSFLKRQADQSIIDGIVNKINSMDGSDVKKLLQKKYYKSRKKKQNLLSATV